MQKTEAFRFLTQDQIDNIVASIETGMAGAGPSSSDLARSAQRQLQYQPTRVGLTGPPRYTQTLWVLRRAADLHEAFRPACAMLEEATKALSSRKAG